MIWDSPSWNHEDILAALPDALCSDVHCLRLSRDSGILTLCKVPQPGMLFELVPVCIHHVPLDLLLGHVLR